MRHRYIDRAAPDYGPQEAALHPGYSRTKNAREEYEMRLAKWAPPGLAVVAALLLASGASPARSQARVTVFEGARVITGDGTAPIENGAIVLTGDALKAGGRAG